MVDVGVPVDDALQDGAPRHQPDHPAQLGAVLRQQPALPPDDGVEAPPPSGENGDPNETLEDQLARIAEGESSHGQLAGKADGVLPGFEEALDVTKGVITIGKDIPVPTYQRAQGNLGFSLGGTEFWQKWSGGLNPTYSYSAGSDDGRKCMQASAIRFQGPSTTLL